MGGGSVSGYPAPVIRYVCTHFILFTYTAFYYINNTHLISKITTGVYVRLSTL